MVDDIYFLAKIQETARAQVAASVHIDRQKGSEGTTSDDGLYLELCLET